MNTSPRTHGIARLEDAFRIVLAGDFEDQVRALVEARAWYSSELPGSEVFRLWISENLTSRDDREWIFQPVRASERKFLCDELGIDRALLVGRDGREVAELLLRAVGLPAGRLSGWERKLSQWREAIELIDVREDERAAVLLRQRAERLLRTVVHFHCAVGLGAEFVSLVSEPGDLRVPRRLADRAAKGSVSGVTDLLLEEGWADLGFLALALRKLSVRAESRGVLHITGARLVLLKQSEYDALQKLAVALQPYTHDKPSQDEVRRGRLRSAAEEMLATLDGLIRRVVLPNEVFVLATGATLFGPAFKSVTDKGKVVTLSASVIPDVGERVLVAASTERNYAGCRWVRSPWPAEAG